MSVAAMDVRSESPPVAAGACRIADVAIFDTMESVEDFWRDLEAGDVLMTPYQRFALQAAWQKHVGARENLQPHIIVGFNADRSPLLVLPLGLRSEAGVRVAHYLGGKHITFNMPLYRRDFAAAAARHDLDDLLVRIKAHRSAADVLAMTRQPMHWRGVRNPMTLLPHQTAVNHCPLLKLAPGQTPAERLSNSFRRRLKGKERKLQALPGYRYSVARDDAEISRALDMFFAIKPQRMAEQKLPYVFEYPGIAQFIRDTCHDAAGGRRTIELHTLTCDEEVIALYAGVADDERFSMMFNTYTLSANAKFSPGLILMRDIIDHYGDRGVRSLDLGIGSDEYKRMFCKDDEPIVDSYLPLSARGAAAAGVLSSFARIKRLVKQTPALMQAAQALRGALRR